MSMVVIMVGTKYTPEIRQGCNPEVIPAQVAASPQVVEEQELAVAVAAALANQKIK